MVNFDINQLYPLTMTITEMEIKEEMIGNHAESSYKMTLWVHGIESILILYTVHEFQDSCVVTTVDASPTSRTKRYHK